MNNEINYYEILEKLKELENKLYSFKNFEDSRDITLTIIKAKAYIFKIPILKNEFIKRVQSFDKDFKTDKYKNNARETYSKIKEIVKNIDENVVYNEYINSYNNTTTNCAYIRYSKYESRSEEDNINLYYYPSLMLPKSKYTQSLVIKEDIEKVKTFDLLKVFYDNIFYVYTQEYLFKNN